MRTTTPACRTCLPTWAHLSPASPLASNTRRAAPPSSSLRPLPAPGKTVLQRSHSFAAPAGVPHALQNLCLSSLAGIAVMALLRSIASPGTPKRQPDSEPVKKAPPGEPGSEPLRYTKRAPPRRHRPVQCGGRFCARATTVAAKALHPAPQGPGAALEGRGRQVRLARPRAPGPAACWRRPLVPGVRYSSAPSSRSGNARSLS